MEEWKNGLWTWLLVAALSVFGGLADAIARYQKDGIQLPFRLWLIKTCGDLFIASFAGFMTFWLYMHFYETTEMTGLLCAAVSMAGYLGGKAIDIFAGAWESIARSKTGSIK